MGRQPLLGFVIAAFAQLSLAEGAAPELEPAFGGRINVSVKDSVPDWPQPVEAPSGAAAPPRVTTGG